MIKLRKEIEKARSKEYELGKHDCALFAIEVIEKVWGIDYGEKIRGCYSSKFSYLKLWKKLGCSTLEEVTNKIIGGKSEEMRKIQNGWLVLYLDDEKNEHLGISIDSKVAIVTQNDGLTFVDLLKCKCCWRMG